MNLYRKNLRWMFLATLLPTLFVPLRLFFFAPFLITLFYKRPLNSCLWGSLLCGLILDLLSPHSRLGLYGATFLITTWILYPQRRNFFADTISTLPLMTLFYSVIATAINIVVRQLFDQPIPIHPMMLLTDFMILPLCDALYAFTVFILPYLIFGKKQLKGKDYFMA